MAKLKFNRMINVTLAKNESISIPSDEVWKVSTNAGRINGSNNLIRMMNSVGIPSFYGIFGGGSSFTGGGGDISYTDPSFVSGVAFKAV